MKFGIADYGVTVWEGDLYDIESRLQAVKEIGFDGIERIEAVSPSDALHKAGLYRKLGMDFTTCRGPNIQSSIEWTAALGKKYIWIVVGEMSRKEVEFDVFCRRVNTLSKAAQRWGIKVGLHNHLRERVETHQELMDFMEKCPDANLVLDTGHSSAAGGDPVEVIKKYSDRISVVHLKDVIVDENQKFDRFCELGAGNNGFSNIPVMEALVEAKYDGWVHIEHDRHQQEPMKDLAISYNYLINAGFKNK
jgi:inosose dehydratase